MSKGPHLLNSNNVYLNKKAGQVRTRLLRTCLLSRFSPLPRTIPKAAKAAHVVFPES